MSKLPVNKEVNLDSYTTLEMTCLIQDIANEITERKNMVGKVLSEFDKKINAVYHDIELNEYTRKEKVEEFDKLQMLLGKRRIVKQELWSVKYVSEKVGIFPLLTGANRAVEHMQSYLKVEDKQCLHSKKGEFARFYKEAKDVYANKV